MIKNKLPAIILCILLFWVNISVFAQVKPNNDANSTIFKKNEINPEWWGKFNDPMLLGYINKAIESNYNLKEIYLNVLAAKAAVRESLGTELPQATLLANYIRIKPPFLFSNPLVERTYVNSFTVPLFASYEVDLWQKNRKRTLAKAEKLESTRQDARATYILLTTEVASAYFNILKLDKLIEIQNCIIALEKENLSIIKGNFKAGLSSRDDVLQAKQSSAEAEKTLIEQDKQRDVFINELLVLTGESTEGRDESSVCRNSLDDLSFPSDIPCKVESLAIMQRPDILKAEAELKYAKINVELARRDFIPDLTVYGLFGFNSNQLKSLFDWKNYIAAAGGSFIGKIFTGGQRLARLKQRKYEYEQMLNSYQETVLTSLQEINDSLYGFKSNLEIDEKNRKQLDFECKKLELANLRYKKGLNSYLDTLNPEKNFCLREQDQIQSRINYYIDSINLYKALGGKI